MTEFRRVTEDFSVSSQIAPEDMAVAAAQGSGAADPLGAFTQLTQADAELDRLQADAALDALDAWRPDVVLLDLGLPDSQGLQTLKDVTQIDGKLAIIVLTGGASASMGLDAVAFGAQDFLVKGSFNAEMLQRSIAFAQHRKGKEVALLERSLHDDLTGLPRRTLLLDRLQAAMQQSTRTGSPAGRSPAFSSTISAT